jgi:DNA-binding XRE family transcriptional regulator
MQLPRVKEWREAVGLTQRELAERAGLGPATVPRVEAGGSASPRTARKISEALSVSVVDLMENPPAPLADARPETSRPPVYISAASGSAGGSVAGLTVGDALAQLEQLAVQFRAGDVGQEEAVREMKRVVEMVAG